MQEVSDSRIVKCTMLYPATLPLNPPQHATAEIRWPRGWRAHSHPSFSPPVEFQVTTQTPSLNLLLGSTPSLHCGFSMAPGLDLTSVEWRQQHGGSGQLVYSWTTMGQGQAQREGATLDPEQLLMAGDATLTLPSLTVKDEGAYICQITTSLYQTQQIVQLHVQGKAGTELSLLGVGSDTRTTFPQPQCHLRPGRAGGIRLGFPSHSRIINSTATFPAQDSAAPPWLVVSSHPRPFGPHPKEEQW